MFIKVTQDHINKGKPTSAKNCPVGLALKEALPSGSSYTVGWDVIDVTLPNGEYKFAMLDKVLVKFMWDFADGKPVEPFTHGIIFMVS